MAGFSEVLGQEHIKEHFSKAIRQNRVAQAYLIEGDDGMGKRMVARAAVMAIQCERQDGQACGECKSCRQLLAGKHPDVREVVHEKPNTIRVDDVRDQLVSDMQIRPYASRHKIYIVPEADKMNPQAQNAILKTIEEPPPYGIVFLLVKNRFSMAETVRSRCVKLSLKPLAKEVIVNYLMCRCGATDYRAHEAAAFADGNLGRAVLLANGEAFFERKARFVSAMKKVPNLADADAEDEAKKITGHKDEMNEFLDLCELWFRDVLYVKSGKDVSGVHFTEESDLLEKYAQMCTYAAIQRDLELIDGERAQLTANVNADAGMEYLLLMMRENCKIKT